MRTGTLWVVAMAAVGAGCAGGGGARAERAQQATLEQQQLAAGAVPTGKPDLWARPGYRPAMATMSGSGSAGRCPMDVPGAQVATADTRDGEAITFTTTSPDQVEELRSRVHGLADMHNRQEHGRMSMRGRTGAGSAGAGGGEQGSGMMGSRAVVEDVDGGARVTVTASDPAEAGRLRKAVRARADHMRRTGACGS